MLITRPQDKGQQLAQQLKTIGVTSTCQSFFDYQLYTNQEKVLTQLSSSPPNIIIFVSVAAVTFANQALPIINWQNGGVQFFAVGQATKQALTDCGIKNAISPNQQNSEGLLALEQLLTVAGKNILIVRGDGGREYLKEGLCQVGAKVHYLESYQRLWRTFDDVIVKQWQERQINAIVITSNALLQRIVDIITAFIDTLLTEDKLAFNHWKNNCLWIVASERIANSAKTLDLVNVINAEGANDQAIIRALNSYI